MSNWIALFDELDRVFKQTGRLLTDTDQLMSAHDYRCAHPSRNQMGFETSGSIQNPGRWYPRWLARFYSRGGVNAPMGTLAFVAVFLSDAAGQEDWTLEPRMTEPLIVAGALEGHPGQTIAWFYWVCKWWFWIPGAKPDGSVVTRDHNDSHNTRFKRLQTFALPISSVSSITDLEQLVVSPLMTLLQQAETSAGV